MKLQSAAAVMYKLSLVLSDIVVNPQPDGHRTPLILPVMGSRCVRCPADWVFVCKQQLSETGPNQKER